MRVSVFTDGRHARQSGFTLLEVMISVLVLSIGLLGLAGLQASGLRNNHSAYLRSQAVFYSYDIIDRMRANRLSALSGTYNIALGTPAPTGSTIAETDLREWKKLLKDNLPSGDGETSVNGGMVTVTVQWDDSRAKGSSTASTKVETQL